MFIIRFAKGVRNHWKKSTFAAGLLAYGVNKLKTNYDIKVVMRAHCEEAKKYGDELQNIMYPNKRLLVILNPAANRKDAEESFHDYCEPILNLGGYLVDVVKTDSEGHAKRYVEEIEHLPDSIIVAGGDGTVSEVVTGLLRRGDGSKCPVGILPVGRINDTATNYFNLPSKKNNVKEADDLANVALAVLRGKKERKNVLKIQPMEDVEEEGAKPKRPIYALNKLHWGAYRDVKSVQDKYWYYGPLRNYAAVFFRSLSKALNWECEASIEFTPPCEGCKNCYLEEKEVDPSAAGAGRWWGRYVQKPVKKSLTGIDYSKVINEYCTFTDASSVKSPEIIVSAVQDSNGLPARLHLESAQPTEPGIDFIKDSWSRIGSPAENQLNTDKVVEGRTITLVPVDEEKYADKFYYIDNEQYEVRPIKISLIPNAIDVYVN